MKKIAILSQTGSHLIHLVNYLNNQSDCEVTFYTIMPPKHCREKYGYRGKVVSFMFPLAIVYWFILNCPGLNAYQRSHLHFYLRKLFDWFCSVFIKKCDVLIAANGAAVRAVEKAEKKYGAITICDQGSSHILTQNAVHYSYSNVPIPDYSTDFMLRHYDVSDYLMAPSVYVRETDMNNGIPADRILYNPYGVDLSGFQVTEKPGEDSYDVLMVGSWWKHKGCDMLAKACVEILKVKLLHVGSVIDCELPDSPLFKHIDFVPEKELPKYYAQAKVFVMPSLDEGLALVLLQAAACGLPIVSSMNAGGRDLRILLNDTESVFVIDETLSPESIASTISKALKYAETMPDGKRDQCQREIANISWEAYGNRWNDILNKLIAK